MEVLGVDVDRRHAPRDVRVVAQRNARQPRRGRADHVPSGRDQVHEVARRWHGEPTARLGERERSAAAHSRAARRRWRRVRGVR